MSKESDAAVKKSLKNFEKNFVKSGREVFDEKCQLKNLSISPSLDFALNGGLLEGTWVQIVGKAKTGKTSTILQIAANAQADGRNVVYLDAEGRIKKYNLGGIKGLDLDKIQLIQSDGNTILTAEMFLNALEEKIKDPDNEGALFIIDSLSSLIPAKELEGYVSGDFRPGLPKLLSNFCKRMGQVVPKTKAIVIGIHHLISAQASMPGAKQWVADGGVKIGYQYDTMMQVSHSKDWIDDDGNRIGQEIHWKILTSSQGTDKTNAVGYFRFNHGLDSVEEIVALGDDFGIFNKKGAWYYMTFLENHKEKIGEELWTSLNDHKCGFQGKPKLCAFLNANPIVMEAIAEEMKEFLA
jgi:recombination protein RecA